jgi:4-hydroxy-3-polyprenylbenzoate decarboxylase
VPLGDDEYSLAGALRAKPLELVRCVSQDLEVPATAEIVLEGETRQVEWALSTRVLPSRDIWITPQNQPGTNLDPAIAPEDRVYPNIRGGRIGTDATEDFKGYQFPPQTRPSPEEFARVDARWAEYGID